MIIVLFLIVSYLTHICFNDLNKWTSVYEVAPKQDCYFPIEEEILVENTTHAYYSWVPIMETYKNVSMSNKLSFNGTCPPSPVVEMLLIPPKFRYTEEVLVTFTNYSIKYHPYLPCKYTHIYRPSIRFGSVYVVPTDEEFSPNLPVFTNVAVVGSRFFVDNIYHFMESANMLLHYLMISNLPQIDYFFFDDNVTDVTSSSWKQGYLDSILSLFPDGHKPTLLPLSLSSTYNQVIFRNVLFLPIITSVEGTFLSSREVDLLRASVYRRFKYSLIPSRSSITVAYFNRTFRRDIVNGNELFLKLKESFSIAKSIAFDGCTFDDQVRTMANIDVLVSIHGAQLSNIVFMKPRSGLIEVFNPFFFLGCYQNIALKAGLNYRSLRDTIVVGSSVNETSWNPYVNLRVNVSVTTVIQVVKELVALLYCVCYKQGTFRLKTKTKVQL